MATARNASSAEAVERGECPTHGPGDGFGRRNRSKDESGGAKPCGRLIGSKKRGSNSRVQRGAFGVLNHSHHRQPRRRRFREPCLQTARYRGGPSEEPSRHTFVDDNSPPVLCHLTG